MTTKTAINRDDLNLSYGYTRTGAPCPVCQSNDDGDDLRLFAFTGPDGRRICDDCTESVAGERMPKLLDEMEDVAIILRRLAAEPDDLEYGRALAVTAFRAMLAEIDREHGTSDAHGGGEL